MLYTTARKRDMKMYVLTMTKAIKNRAYHELKSNAGILQKGNKIAACWADKHGK